MSKVNKVGNSLAAKHKDKDLFKKWLDTFRSAPKDFRNALTSLIRPAIIFKINPDDEAEVDLNSVQDIMLAFIKSADSEQINLKAAEAEVTPQETATAASLPGPRSAEAAARQDGEERGVGRRPLSPILDCPQHPITHP